MGNVIKVKPGETRQEGFLYFVKGIDLEVYKCEMARGKKPKKNKSKKKK